MNNNKEIIKDNNHTSQLGSLIHLCDDVILLSCEFLTNKETFNMSQLSKSYLFKQVNSRRLKVFKKQRKKVIENCIQHRNPQFQYASTIFKQGICVKKDCGKIRCKLVHFTKKNIYVPYCTVCWLGIVLKYANDLINNQ